MQDHTRVLLLRQLTKHPELSQREIALRLGLSLGKTHYCLRALIDEGWVKVNNFRNSHNKLGYSYVLTPRGLRAKAAVTAAFLRRKQDEYAQLEREIAELRQELGAQAGTAARPRDDGLRPSDPNSDAARPANRRV